jgi:hypothetical protein
MRIGISEDTVAMVRGQSYLVDGFKQQRIAMKCLGVIEDGTVVPEGRAGDDPGGAVSDAGMGESREGKTSFVGSHGQGPGYGRLSNSFL